MVRTQPVDYIVCAAGRGERLKKTLPNVPKPLMKLNGQTLLERSLSSLDLQNGDRLIIVCQKSDRLRARLAKRIGKKYSNVEIKWLELHEITRGQLETALLAKEQLRSGHPVAIFNADTYFKLNADWWTDDVDGSIPCASAEGDAWSFCQVDADGFVERVTEKDRVSDRASVGFYYFRNSDLLTTAANEELRELTIDRETFVAPIYNRLIAKGAKITSPMVQTFQPMGSLDQIEKYWQVSAQALQRENQPVNILNYIAAIAGLLVTLLLFSPGFVDNDTNWQFSQAQLHDYSSWHPPLLAWVWHWLLFLVPGSWGMFLLNNVMFWLGLSLTVGAFLQKRPLWAPVVTLGIGLCPWMFTYDAFLWKDASFASAALLGAGLLFNSEGRRRSPFLFAGICLCLFFATGVRHNGIAGVFPLLLILTQQFRRPVLSAIALSVTGYLLNSFLTSMIATNSAPSQAFLTYDLGGISVHADKNVFPPDIFKVTLKDVQHEYRPTTVEPLLWATFPEDKNPRPGFVAPKDMPKLVSAWAKAIVDFPDSYLLHRIYFTRALLGLYVGEEAGRMHLTRTLLPHDPSPFRVDHLTQKYFLKMITMQNESFFFRGYTFLGILILLGFYFALFGTVAENALVFSGLAYFASFVAFGVASDFRYIWWMVIVTTLLFVRFLISEMERAPQYLKAAQQKGFLRPRLIRVKRDHA